MKARPGLSITVLVGCENVGALILLVYLIHFSISVQTLKQP